MAILEQIEDVKHVLTSFRRVAVLGAHIRESKPAHYVPAYLDAQGYDIYPVNPVFAGKTLFGREIVASLADLAEPVEVVDVFRRSEALPEHVADILAMTPLPEVVWLQSGIRHDEVAAELSAAGIDVIQSRCMLADHRRWCR